ncbi:MAG: hypothetical protein H7840_13190 [Alphaproteobacteria bacterium]
MAGFFFGGSRDGKTRLLAALSYLGVFCFIPLLSNEDDEFIQFHAKQGLVLWLVTMVTMLSLFVPAIGSLLVKYTVIAVPVYSLIGLLAVGLSKTWKLPGVYQLGLKL